MQAKLNLYSSVSKKCGITAQMLYGQPPFSVVFQQFLGWINQCVEEVCSNDLYHPGKLQMTANTHIVTSYSLVLVAHNGFAFDYLFLMAEIKRRSLEESFNTTSLWFADTLYDARRVG